RIRLLRQRQTMLARQLSNLRLGHVAQRETRAAELLLGQAKQEVSLVLGRIGSATQQPAVANCIELAPGVVGGGQKIGADLPRSNQQLIKLQVVVAKAARDRSPAGEILLDKRTYHITLKALLMIDHVIRNAQIFSDAASVVDIVN